MSLDHTKTLAFIEDYRSFTALWDGNSKDCANRIKRNDALNVLATDYKTSPAPVSLVSLGVMESKTNISDLYANQGQSYTPTTPAPVFFSCHFLVFLWKISS
jgi:hypothetical protein